MKIANANKYQEIGDDQGSYSEGWKPARITTDISSRKSSVTTREKDVLNLIAQGCTTYEIARTLFVSIDTVKSHKRNLFHKLGTRNGAMTVMRAIQYELIPISTTI